MILPDVNVLLYAFRSDTEDHDRYRRWLMDVANGVEPYGIAPQTLASLIRIATHPKIFPVPSRLGTVITFCDALTGQPNCRIVQPGDRHWPLFLELCQAAGATGNLVQDAWFAALAIEHGCEWITTDGDFVRFAGLRARRPF